MKAKSKGGRPTKDQRPLIIERTLVAKELARKGYNQVDIAYILGVDRSRVNRMLRG
jgi:predicted XRE-type DNA-binding protein